MTAPWTATRAGQWHVPPDGVVFTDGTAAAPADKSNPPFHKRSRFRTMPERRRFGDGSWTADDRPVGVKLGLSLLDEPDCELESSLAA